MKQVNSSEGVAGSHYLVRTRSESGVAEGETQKIFILILQGKLPIDLCQPCWSDAYNYTREILAAV